MSSIGPDSSEPSPGYSAGRFTARPKRAPNLSVEAGVTTAAGEAGWSGRLLVPEGRAADRPGPFMLVLHGATGNGERMLGRWQETAERHAVVVLAPDSLERTWDVLTGGYGPDVARLDRALAYAFARVAVDPEHVFIEGFSDGASYALSLGLANGGLFTHVLANSPGFCWPPSFEGKPAILLTHGTQDAVLPINQTSRLLAPQLVHAGYAVTYHEFEGPHSLTPEIMTLSLEWAGAGVAGA